MSAIGSTPAHGRPDATGRARLLRAMVYLFVSMLPCAAGVGLGIPERHLLAPTSIYANGGGGFAVPVPPSVLSPLFTTSGDAIADLQRSNGRLTEDSSTIGPPHSLHASIVATGRGQFSHWGDALLFSASDNTDPRANGRRYEFHVRSRLPSLVWLTWAVSVVFGVRQRATDRLPATPVVPAAVFAVLACGLASYSLVYGAAGAPATVVFAAWIVSLAFGCLFAFVGGRLLATCSLDVAPWEHRWRVVADAADRALGPFDRRNWQGRLWRLATVAAAAAAFVTVVYRPWPDALLVAFHDDHAVLFWWGLPVLLLALWRRGWAGVATSVTVVLVGVAFPLAARWHDASLHGNAMGGLLPFSDARGYWLEANRLLDGVPLQWAARRPAFTAFLSTLFALTGRNLEWSLAFLTAMNGLAIALMALELRRSVGPLAGAISVLVMLAFFGFDGGLGTVLTENLGLAVAALGFAAIVRGSRESRPATYAIGVGLMTFALMARAGAFFVLPALVPAAAWEFRAQWRRATALVLTAVAVAAVLSIGSGRLLSAPAGEQQAFSNFSYSLYGLVAGGKGWQQVVKEHPDAREGSEIYLLAWQAFKARPSGVVEGALRMWRLYVDVTSTSAFHAFVFVRSPTLQSELTLACYLAAGLGLVVAILGLNRPLHPTLVAGLVGHLASIPFVPPIDAGLRVYAATMPFIAALVAVGAAAPLVALGQRVFARSLGDPGGGRRVEWPHAPVVLGLGIVVATTLVPQVLLRSGRAMSPRPVSCGPGQIALFVRVTPGAQLDVVGDGEPRLMAATRLRVEAMRRTLAMVDPDGRVRGPVVGQSLVSAYDVYTGVPAWIVGATADVPGPGVYDTCVSPAVDASARLLGVYYSGGRWRPVPSREHD